MMMSKVRQTREKKEQVGRNGVIETNRNTQCITKSCICKRQKTQKQSKTNISHLERKKWENTQMYKSTSYSVCERQRERVSLSVLWGKDLFAVLRSTKSLNLRILTPQPPWESLYQGAGKEGPSIIWTSDTGGTMWFSSRLWNTWPAL